MRGVLARRRLDGLLEVQPAEAGMHLVGWLPDGVDDVAESERAGAAGLVATPLARHYILAPRHIAAHCYWASARIPKPSSRRRLRGW